MSGRKAEMGLTEICTVKDGIADNLAGGEITKWFAKNIPLFSYIFHLFLKDWRAIFPADVKARKKHVVWYTFNLKIRL